MDGSDVLDSDKPCSEQGCFLNQDITFDTNNPNIAYTVWLSPQSWGGDGIGKVGRSTDGGSTWTAYSLGSVPADTLQFKTIAVHPSDSEVIYAGEFNKRCLQESGSWADLDAVTDLEFHPENTKVIYAGTLSNGIYVSPNEAGDWLKIGTPKYDVLAISTSSLYVATQGGLLQCTGTGLIAGQVKDALSQSCIKNATVFNDFGVKTISVNGEYMMVSPSGTCVVTAITDGYAHQTTGDITVYGEDVTWVDIAMGSQISEPSTPGQGSDHSGRDYQCFIATSAYGSSMAEQVQMLRLEINTFFLVPSAKNWFPCITPQENQRDSLLSSMAEGSCEDHSLSGSWPCMVVPVNNRFWPRG